MVEFVLADDPVAKQRQWATRHWCAGCLVEKGHVAPRKAQRAVAAALRAAEAAMPPPPQLLTRDERDAAAAKVREHQIVADLLSHAEDDPTLARALLRAAAGVRLMQSQPRIMDSEDSLAATA